MKKITFSKIIGSTGVFNDGDWVESKDQDPNGEVRLIQLADIGDGIFIDKSNRFLTSEKAKQLKCTYLKEGDVLVARMPDPLGRACIFPKLDKPCVTVVDVCIIRPDSKIANNTYIKFLINSPDFRNKINRFASGTTRQRISRKNLDKISFSLPDYDTQLHIANILSKAESLINQRKESIRLLDKYLKSVFLEMFGDPVRNEKGWEKKKLNEISKVGTGGTPSRKKEDLFYGGNINWAKTTEVNGSYIFNTEEKITEIAIKESNCKIYPEYTILLAMYGQGKTRGNVGLLKIEAATNQACAAIPPCNNIDQVFLFELLKNSYDFIRSLARGGNQENLNLSIVGNIDIIIPPLELQIQFSQIVEKTEALKAQYQQSLQELENLYGSLSQKAFKGELTVKDESLLMAAEPETKYQAKVKPLKPTSVDYYKRMVLAAEIVWQLQNEPTLGHLKLQKLIYLCQRSAEMQLPTNFLKQAMGPYDPQMMRSIDKQLKLKEWFQYNKSEFLKYVPLRNAGQHQDDFIKYFSEEQSSIQYIIDTFKTKKSDVIEITATLYACLDEMYMKNIIYSEPMLLKMFYDYSERKKNFPEHDVKQVFKAMQLKGIVPKTFKN